MVCSGVEYSQLTGSVQEAPPRRTFCDRVTGLFQSARQYFSRECFSSLKNRVARFFPSVPSDARVGSYLALGGTSLATAMYGVYTVAAGQFNKDNDTLGIGIYILFVSFNFMGVAIYKVAEIKQEKRFRRLPFVVFGFVTGSMTGAYTSYFSGRSVGVEGGGWGNFLVTNLATIGGGLLSLPTGLVAVLVPRLLLHGTIGLGKHAVHHYQKRRKGSVELASPREEKAPEKTQVEVNVNIHLTRADPGEAIDVQTHVATVSGLRM